MTNCAAGELLGSDRRVHGVDAPGGRFRTASLLRRRCGWWLVLIASFAVAGCASPSPEVDDDVEAFTRGIDGMLKVGMSINEARDLLREHMPKPSINTQVTAPVPSANAGMQMRRYQIGWPTLSPGTTLIVTIFCDRDGKIVRWTTGPLTDNK